MVIDVRPHGWQLPLHPLQRRVEVAKISIVELKLLDRDGAGIVKETSHTFSQRASCYNSSYSTDALGQLFFFHVVLIQKGMRTYYYILAMREGANSGS
ncbi:hypothetical protein MLD38_009064 [Melastoma candidum]|uniref:Uncharacterized protein n=1 Tax=Melastoma candidum TaxID=119954 RepID=A0ACB9S4W4_9MYRT|nr:hypothetical protein MLD38_009064 [Melastoma candidum]